MKLSAMNRMVAAKPLFSLLKRIFLKEVDSDLLMELQRINVDMEEDDLDRGFNLVSQAARKNYERLNDYVEDLAVEFARLFIGPKRAPAIPFASVYLSEDRTVMSEVTLGVREQYLAVGLAVENLYQIPEDHIAFELEFIEYLIDRLSKLKNMGDQEEVDQLEELMETFFNKHLVTWAPSFADLILEHTTEDFYKGSALILKEICRQN